MLAFLGWNPGTTQELFTLSELVDAFSLERVSKAGAKFDAEKTKWFQQQYLRATPTKELATELQHLLTEQLDSTFLEQVCELMKERATFIHDILVEGDYFFADPSSYDEQTVKKKWKDNSGALMTEWVDILSTVTNFDAATIEERFKAFLVDKELGIGAVLPLFRLLVTGKGMGPSMFDIAALIGKDNTIQRMKTGITHLG
jgi:glutamyl-tRNA synthetase